MDDLRGLAFNDDKQVVELHIRQSKGSGKPRVEVELLTGEELADWLKDYLESPDTPVDHIVQLFEERFATKAERRALLEDIIRRRTHPDEQSMSHRKEEVEQYVKG